MTDKLRTTYPISITIAPGDQPTAVTLNAIGNQAKAGLGIVEKAVGDVWGQGGDSVYSEYPLQITNIGRVLGRQYLGNAHFVRPDLSPGAVLSIEQNVVNQQGQTVLALDFIPQASSVAITALTENVTSIASLTTSQFYVDAANARVHLGAPLGAVTTITYTVLDTNLPEDNESAGGFNVIPDPRAVATGWEGLKFYKVSTDKYLLFLPPRCATDLAGEGHLPDNTSGNIASDETTLKYYFPVKATFEAIASLPTRTAMSKMPEYRYTLPEEIAELMSSGSDGDLLPENSMYLWDNDTNSIVQGITFRVPEAVAGLYADTVLPRPAWVLQVSAAGLDALLDAYDVATITVDDPDDYILRFSLITVGQSVAKSLDTLRTGLTSHSHGAGAESRVSHRDLLNPSPPSTSAIFGTQKLATPVFAGDDHPLYLARTGTGVGTDRDKYKNGMMGNLLMLSSDSTTDYQNLTFASRKILFGTTAGPAIFLDVSGTDSLELAGASTMPVSIGKSNASTHLLLSNNQVQFGTAFNTLALSGNVFTFSTTSSVDNSEVAAGFLRTTQGDLSFGASGVAGSLFFDNGTNIFQFNADSLVTASIVKAGKFWVGADEILWGSGNDKITFNDGTNAFSFDSDGVAATATINAGAINGTNITAGGYVLAGTNVVSVGFINAGTDLITEDGNVYFGITANNDKIFYNTGTTTFEFQEAGSSTSSKIKAGTVRTNVITNAAGTAYTRRVVVNTGAFFLKEGAATNNYIYPGRQDYASFTGWTTPYMVFQVDPGFFTAVTKVHVLGHRTGALAVTARLQDYDGTEYWSFTTASASGAFTIDEVLSLSPNPNPGEPLFLLVESGAPNGASENSIQVKFAYFELEFSTLQNILGLS